MTKKIHNVEPFRLTYTVQNIYTGQKFDELESIEHALYYAKFLICHAKTKTLPGKSVAYSGSFYDLFTNSFHKNAHGWTFFVKGGVYYRWINEYVRAETPPIIIYDNLGRVVEPGILTNHKPKNPDYKNSYRKSYEEWRNKRNKIDRSLCKHKGDARKVKTNWAVTETVDKYGDVDYTYAHSHFRSVGTKNEQTQNVAHMDEHGYEMVRGRRRKLVSSWDDVTSSYWGCRRSWKHNSKRRKQWVPKD